ncbi:hypothetical protein AB4114_29735 [Paenibacillus sp. 2RAB27]|uniref:hypothetical protein n=1 Tax=Paenibacillus sp. 2RAB27 TaxID=3232991 RepID=UPI003F9D44B6
MNELIIKEKLNKAGMKIQAIFNLTKLKKNANGLQQIFVVDSSNDEKLGYLDFEYCGDGTLLIIGFHSDEIYRGNGHGRMMHELLLEIAPTVENEALKQGFKRKLTYIDGKIREHGISKSELIEIYKKLGYEIIDNERIKYDIQINK